MVDHPAPLGLYRLLGWAAWLFCSYEWSTVLTPTSRQSMLPLARCLRHRASERCRRSRQCTQPRRPWQGACRHAADTCAPPHVVAAAASSPAPWLLLLLQSSSNSMAASLQSTAPLRAARRGAVRRSAQAAQHFQQPQVRSLISIGCCSRPANAARPKNPRPHPCLQGLEQRQQVASAAVLEGSGSSSPAPAGLRASAAAAPTAAAPAAPAAKPPPPDGHRLQLHYRSTWQQPVLHHSICGGEWRGVPMQRVGAWGASGDRAKLGHLDPCGLSCPYPLPAPGRPQPHPNLLLPGGVGRRLARG